MLNLSGDFENIVHMVSTIPEQVGLEKHMITFKVLQLVQLFQVNFLNCF